MDTPTNRPAAADSPIRRELSLRELSGRDLRTFANRWTVQEESTRVAAFQASI
ncbi:MAG TPA: hypothetical protein VFU73_08795 [Actinocrinis sp.]|nr:hypothetical protein [Actinocrinis sp.]